MQIIVVIAHPSVERPMQLGQLVMDLLPIARWQ
jgi:hypothetical protein